jgi:hypothetical protein
VETALGVRGGQVATGDGLTLDLSESTSASPASSAVRLRRGLWLGLCGGLKLPGISGCQSMLVVSLLGTAGAHSISMMSEEAYASSKLVCRTLVLR